MKIKDNELYKRVDEVLFYIWDPISVSDEPYARDEYLSYLPTVYNLLIEDKPKEKIIQYLNGVLVDKIGMARNDEHTNNVVEILLKYKEIFNQNT